MLCPACEEKIDRKFVIENEYRCPMCDFSFNGSDDDLTDDFDDLMMTDFVDDDDDIDDDF